MALVKVIQGLLQLSPDARAIELQPVWMNRGDLKWAAETSEDLLGWSPKHWICFKENKEHGAFCVASVCILAHRFPASDLGILRETIFK